jgi:opacity protein-like surface antigen
MIRRLSLAAMALLLAAPAAHAGASCYVGLGAGKSLTNAEVAETSAGTVNLTLEGFQIGARAGCDVGVPLSPLVLGGFVGYDFMDADSAGENYASIGARAGFKLNDSAVAYGLIGLAAPDFQFTDADNRGVMYGAGLEIDFSNVSPGLVGFVEFSRIDWRDTGTDASTDTIMVGAKIKLNVLK